MTKSKKRTTRDEIIYTAAKLFFERGFSETSAKILCEELHISTGNLTYYFATKEHLLRVMVQKLCRFQWEAYQRITQEGQSPLMAACLELAAMAAVCEEDPIARDFYLATYTSPLALEIIRQEDCVRAKQVFADHCPDWKDADYQAAQVLVSGIEYATLVQIPTAPPLDQRIRGALQTILQIFHVPPELRKKKLEKVMSLDYRAIGRNIFREFTTYLLCETGLPEDACLTT